MRLLFVCTAPGGGGLETHFVALANAMAAAGNEVAVFIYRGERIDQQLDASVTRYYGRFRGAADPRGLWGLTRTVRRIRPQWMIGSLSKEYWPVALIGHYNRIPVALFKHVPTVMRRGSRYFLPRLVSRFIMVSDYMRRYYSEQGIPRDRMQTLHNPIDTGFFDVDPQLRADMRAKHGVAEGDVVIGYVGKIDRGKGALVLAQAVNAAMRLNPVVRMLWVGAGEDMDFTPADLTAGCQDPGHHIFVDWASDVRPYYAMMDVMTLPSIGAEAFGRASVEAQACGVPVLGSDLGGIPETMEDGVSGRLLPPGDVVAWCDAILELAADPALRDRMGAVGREFVQKRFSAAVIAEQFTRLLQDPAR